MHGSRNPARGVVVAPFIGPKVFGLSMSQTKAWRSTNGTTPHHLKGGPFVVGLPSLTRACIIKPTRSVYQHRTPGRRRSVGTSCKGPSNPIFQGKIDTRFMDIERNGRSCLKRLKRYHAGLVGRNTSTAHPDFLKYKDERENFVNGFPNLRPALARAEAEHYASLLRD